MLIRTGENDYDRSTLIERYPPCQNENNVNRNEKNNNKQMKTKKSLTSLHLYRPISDKLKNICINKNLKSPLKPSKTTVNTHFRQYTSYFAPRNTRCGVYSIGVTTRNINTRVAEHV